MCNHAFKRFNDVLVCYKCGLTKIASGGKYEPVKGILFDRRLPDTVRKRKTKKKKCR